MNPKTSEVTKTYRFSTMSSWSVHWENREVIVDFEEEKLAIKPLSADCKVFHEFLGKVRELCLQITSWVYWGVILNIIFMQTYHIYISLVDDYLAYIVSSDEKFVVKLNI